jgi:hypothetical protein
MRRILVDLHSGAVFRPAPSPSLRRGFPPEIEKYRQAYELAVERGQLYLLMLAECLYSYFEENSSAVLALQYTDFLNSLKEDGQHFVGGKVMPTSTTIVDEPEQLYLVQELVEKSRHDKKEVLLSRFVEGQKLIASGSWRAAVGQWRCFLKSCYGGYGG